MPLHGGEYWNDVARRDGGAFLVVHPPFVESSIWAYKEALLRGGCFRECVRNVGPKNEEIFRGCDGVEETGACLINAISVGFV